MKIGRGRAEAGTLPASSAAARDAIGGTKAELARRCQRAHTRANEGVLAVAQRESHTSTRFGVNGGFEEAVRKSDSDDSRRPPADARTAPLIALTLRPVEYGYDVFTSGGCWNAGAVDVLQADATRGMGISGLFFSEVLPLSCGRVRHPTVPRNTAPSLHLRPAAPSGRVKSYRYTSGTTPASEQMLFVGSAAAARRRLSVSGICRARASVSSSSERDRRAVRGALHWPSPLHSRTGRQHTTVDADALQRDLSGPQ
jgi:hypothetical protein